MLDEFFEWDDDKAESNAKEHEGVTFEEARSIFSDLVRVEFYDEEHSEEEGRYAAIGFSSRARLLFVVYTPRGDRIRIISARTARADEARIYEQDN